MHRHVLTLVKRLLGHLLLLSSLLPPAQFIVHVRRKGIVALQSGKDPNAWLRIEDNTVDGKAS